MKKLALVAGLVLAASLVAAPLAFAQDTSPTSQACTDAKKATADLRVALDTAVFEERKREERDLKKAEEALASSKAEVITYNPNVYPAAVPTVDQVTPALLAAMLADDDLGGEARGQVEKALADFKAVDGAKAAVAAESAATAGVRARLALAIDAQNKACNPPVTVTTTTPPPAPVTTTTPPPTPPAATTAPPAAGPGADFDQVGTIPAGSIDTGRA